MNPATGTLAALAGAALLLTGLAGCSSDADPPVVVEKDGTPIATLTPGGESASPTAAELSAKGVAAEIGCTGFKASTTPQMYVADQGTCRMGGAEVWVYVFDRQSDADAWWDVGSQFGLPNVVRVGLVAVDAVNRSNRDAVEAALSD